MELREPPDWWKKWKPLRWLLGLTVLLGIASQVFKRQVEDLLIVHPETQAYTESVLDTVLLMDGLKSYEAVADVLSTLTERGMNPEQRSSLKPGTSNYPPRNLETLTVAGYVHLGVTGDLTLEFFNDRLYEAAFKPSPSDLPRYIRALKPAEPSLKRDALGKAELLQGPRRVASNIEYAVSDVGRAAGSEAFIVWQDTRLVRQRDAWDANFSLISIGK
mgnify:CR=1 FL=1